MNAVQGAKIAALYGMPNVTMLADKFVSNIKGIDDVSIVNACKLTTFDVWFRKTSAAPMVKTATDTNPDSCTIQNCQNWNLILSISSSTIWLILWETGRILIELVVIGDY